MKKQEMFDEIVNRDLTGKLRNKVEHKTGLKPTSILPDMAALDMYADIVGNSIWEDSLEETIIENTDLLKTA